MCIVSWGSIKGELFEKKDTTELPIEIQQFLSGCVAKVIMFLANLHHLFTAPFQKHFSCQHPASSGQR